MKTWIILSAAASVYITVGVLFSCIMIMGSGEKIDWLEFFKCAILWPGFFKGRF